MQRVYPPYAFSCLAYPIKGEELAGPALTYLSVAYYTPTWRNVIWEQTTQEKEQFSPAMR
jgi:hypothetical protein